jgi:L-lactate dehydrogenase complex protein LldG
MSAAMQGMDSAGPNASTNGNAKTSSNTSPNANREAFLKRIADKLGRPTPRVAPSILPSTSARALQGDIVIRTGAKNCIDLLISRFQSQGGKAVYANSMDVILDVLKETKEKHNLQQAILWDDARIASLGLSDELNRLDISVTSDPMSADMGITFAEWGVAETGTFAIYNRPNKPRSVSLVPNIYIILVRETSVVPTMNYVLDDMSKIADADGLPSCVNLIAGPSSTADIELELVIGVHGPAYVTAIILGKDLLQG